MKRLAALVLAATTGVLSATPAQACWWWPWGMGYYGYTPGYSAPNYGSYPAYSVGYRPTWGTSYSMGYPAFSSACCAPACCDPCGNACNGAACGNNACAGNAAQPGSSLKPQTDSNFQSGGNSTYDADPTNATGAPKKPANTTPKAPVGDPDPDATFDAPATPRRSAPAGSTDDFNASGAEKEEVITPFGSETGVTNKPPVPEIKDLDPVQPDSTFAPATPAPTTDPTPAQPTEAEPFTADPAATPIAPQPAATTPTDPATPDPAATKPADPSGDGGDVFLPVEPTAPAPKPAAPEARRGRPQVPVASQSSRLHEVLRPARLATKPAVDSKLTLKPASDKVRWISAPAAEGQVRL